MPLRTKPRQKDLLKWPNAPDTKSTVFPTTLFGISTPKRRAAMLKLNIDRSPEGLNSASRVSYSANWFEQFGCYVGKGGNTYTKTHDIILFWRTGLLLYTTNLNADVSTITAGDEHVDLHTVGGDCLLGRTFLNNDEISLGKACACWVEPGKAISELDLFHCDTRFWLLALRILELLKWRLLLVLWRE